MRHYVRWSSVAVALVLTAGCKVVTQGGPVIGTPTQPGKVSASFAGYETSEIAIGGPEPRGGGCMLFQPQPARACTTARVKGDCAENLTYAGITMAVVPYCDDFRRSAGQCWYKSNPEGAHCLKDKPLRKKSYPLGPLDGSPFGESVSVHWAVHTCQSLKAGGCVRQLKGGVHGVDYAWHWGPVFIVPALVKSGAEKPKSGQVPKIPGK